MILSSSMLGNLPYFLSSADFFQNQHFKKFLSGIPTECQTVWIPGQARRLVGPAWVETVCKGYQQTTLADEELNLSFNDFKDVAKSAKHTYGLCHI